MSKRNNMNPDHYVGRGRDRNATGIDYGTEKQHFGTAHLRRSPRQGEPNLIPGAAPVGEPDRKTTRDPSQRSR